MVERYAQDPDARPRREPESRPPVGEPLDADLDAFERPPDAEETAADVMTSEVYSVPIDARVPRIAKTMGRHGVHRVLVRDGRRLVGLVGSLELLEVLAEMDVRR